MLTDDRSLFAFVFNLVIQQNHEFHGDHLSKNSWIDKIPTGWKRACATERASTFRYRRDKTARPDGLRNRVSRSIALLLPFLINRANRSSSPSPKDRLFYLRIPWKRSKLERSRRRIRMVTGRGRVRASKSLRGGTENAHPV